MERLTRDWPELTTFYDFPQPHWKSLRTSNVVESPFAAVRLRTAAGKRFQKVTNATLLIWKVLQVAEQMFRRLDVYDMLERVAQGVLFADGREVQPPVAAWHPAKAGQSGPREPIGAPRHARLVFYGRHNRPRIATLCRNPPRSDAVDKRANSRTGPAILAAQSAAIFRRISTGRRTFGRK